MPGILQAQVWDPSALQRITPRLGNKCCLTYCRGELCNSHPHPSQYSSVFILTLLHHGGRIGLSINQSCLCQSINHANMPIKHISTFWGPHKMLIQISIFLRSIFLYQHMHLSPASRNIAWIVLDRTKKHFGNIFVMIVNKISAVTVHKNEVLLTKW